MNQFKRAKSERVNSGKPIEKASDLTTAGTADTANQVEEAKKIDISEEKIEPKKVQQDISPIKEEIELPVETKLDTSDTTISNPKDTDSSQPELIPQVTIPKPVAPIEEATIPEEQQVQSEFPSEPVPVAHEIITEPEPVVIPAPEPTYIPEATVIHEEPITQPIAQAPVKMQTVVTQAPMQPTQVQTVPTIQQIPETVVVQIPTASYPVMQEPVATPIIKEVTPKKSAPNIFHNKGESKSVRKSLVLKPTSVKIAENYCSKNGGSFNELIQHLLDNFIDEYGLR